MNLLIRSVLIRSRKNHKATIECNGNIYCEIILNQMTHQLICKTILERFFIMLSVSNSPMFRTFNMRSVTGNKVIGKSCCGYREKSKCYTEKDVIQTTIPVVCLRFVFCIFMSKRGFDFRSQSVL